MSPNIIALVGRSAQSIRDVADILYDLYLFKSKLRAKIMTFDEIWSHNEYQVEETHDISIVLDIQTVEQMINLKSWDCWFVRVLKSHVDDTKDPTESGLFGIDTIIADDECLHDNVVSMYNMFNVIDDVD